MTVGAGERKTVRSDVKLKQVNSPQDAEKLRDFLREALQRIDGTITPQTIEEV